jgi:hypothetical protein
VLNVALVAARKALSKTNINPVCSAVTSASKALNINKGFSNKYVVSRGGL